MTLQYTAVIIAMACYTDIAGPLYMSHGHGGSRAWGIITACEPIGALVGALIGARWKPTRLVLATAALPAAGAIPMLMLADGIAWPALAVASVLPGTCQALYYVLWTTALQNTFAPEILVRVNSWNIVASYVLLPITALVAGPVVEPFGPQQATLGAAILIVSATALTLGTLRSAPTLARHPAT